MHEPSDACIDVHCHSCHEDEPGSGYIVCGECGHLYRTAGDLRRAYRREYWRLYRAPPTDLFGMERVPMWRVVWQILTIRAKKIYFCQHCIHDF